MLTFRIKHYPVFILLALFFVLHQSFSLFLPSLISTISHFFKRLDGSFLKPTEAYLQLSTDQQKKKLNIPVTRNFTCQRKIKSTPLFTSTARTTEWEPKEKSQKKPKAGIPDQKLLFTSIATQMWHDWHEDPDPTQNLKKNCTVTEQKSVLFLCLQAYC